MSAGLKPIRLIIFDLDGTLVDTLEDIASSVNHVLLRLGRSPLDRDTVRRYVGDGIETLMERSLGGKTDGLDEAVRVYREHHGANLLVKSRLYPGVVETLEQFKSIPLAVISNKSLEFITPLLEGLGISRYFSFVVGADSGLPLKPAPDTLRKVMADAGVPRERTVIVGDGTTDVYAGKAAGVITCSLTCGFRSEEELRRAAPDHMIHTILSLKELFTAEKL